MRSWPSQSVLEPFDFASVSIGAATAAVLLPQIAHAAPVSSPAAHTFESELRRTVIVAGHPSRYERASKLRGARELRGVGYRAL